MTSVTGMPGMSRSSTLLLASLVFLGPILGPFLGSTIAAREPPSISGVHEVAIGTTRPIPLIEYFQQFGYRVGRSGELDADAAEALYGVRSGLRSIRLLHQDADHGLYRLMVWEKPRNQGLDLAHMKVLGGRWGAAVTRDVHRILNHAEDAAGKGQAVYFVEPQRQVIYAGGPNARPFLDPALCVREMLLVRPETRQILFQRYDYELPLYGHIAEDAPLATSQVTHAGLITHGGPEALDFYDQVLGLLRARHGHISDESDPASRAIFELEPGQKYMSTDFDDPRSDPSDLSKVRSGRLKIIRFIEGPELEDLRDRSRPGSLGLSLYTYRVTNIEDFHRRVAASTATEVTAVLVNEFGEKSFSFVAPDGYSWNLVE